jgi:hypothetical protein
MWLKDHPDLFSRPAQFSLRKLSEIHAVHIHFTGGRTFQKVGAPHERRFPGAGKPYDAANLPPPDFQIDLPDRFDGVLLRLERLADIFQNNHLPNRLLHLFARFSIQKKKPSSRASRITRISCIDVSPSSKSE